MKKKYSIQGEKEIIHLIDRAIRMRLEKEKYEQRVHLSEPIYEKTLYEYRKQATDIALSIDNDSLSDTILELKSDDVDISALVHASAMDVIGECVMTYLKPMTRKKQRVDIIKTISEMLGELFS